MRPRMGAGTQRVPSLLMVLSSTMTWRSLLTYLGGGAAWVGVQDVGFRVEV